MDDLEIQVNEALLSNGWDYDDRKRVMFMLCNRKPRPRSLKESVATVYKHYGTNLTAFFADAHAEAKANAERRRMGGV